MHKQEVMYIFILFNRRNSLPFRLLKCVVTVHFKLILSVTDGWMISEITTTSFIVVTQKPKKHNKKNHLGDHFSFGNNVSLSLIYLCTSSLHSNCKQKHSNDSCLSIQTLHEKLCLCCLHCPIVFRLNYKYNDNIQCIVLKHNSTLHLMHLYVITNAPYSKSSTLCPESDRALQLSEQLLSRDGTYIKLSCFWCPDRHLMCCAVTWRACMCFAEDTVFPSVILQSLTSVLTFSLHCHPPANPFPLCIYSISPFPFWSLWLPTLSPPQSLPISLSVVLSLLCRHSAG